MEASTAALVDEAMRVTSSPKQHHDDDDEQEIAVGSGESLKEALAKHEKETKAALQEHENNSNDDEHDHDDDEEETFTMVQRAFQEATAATALLEEDDDEDLLKPPALEDNNHAPSGGEEKHQIHNGHQKQQPTDFLTTAGSVTRAPEEQAEMLSAIGNSHQQLDAAVVNTATINLHNISNTNDEGDNEIPLVCCICEKADERPVLRFLPVEQSLSVLTAAPHVQTFPMDICLHIFCGKTASILPSVNQPDLEILTKAGIKNKHGIGFEVSAALARTRCAILAEEGVKEKCFYLVREFEANLAAVRHTQITFVPRLAMHHTTKISSKTTPRGSAGTAAKKKHSSGKKDKDNHHSSAPLVAASIPPIALPPHYMHPNTPTMMAMPSQLQLHQHNGMALLPDPFSAQYLHFESTGPSALTGSPTLEQLEAMVHQQHLHQLQQNAVFATTMSTTAGMNATTNNNKLLPVKASRTSKVHCECGGTHLPTHTAKGIQSWRNHILTKRHQKWMESNAHGSIIMFGSV
jgi:hypothetical protein